MRLLDLLFQEKLIKSKKEGQRLINQGGIKVNKEVVSDIFMEAPMDFFLQIGKRDAYVFKNGKNANVHKSDIAYELYYWDICSKEVFDLTIKQIFYGVEDPEHYDKYAIPGYLAAQDYYEMSVQKAYLGSVDWDKVEEEIKNGCKRFGWFQHKRIEIPLTRQASTVNIEITTVGMEREFGETEFNTERVLRKYLNEHKKEIEQYIKNNNLEVLHISIPDLKPHGGSTGIVHRTFTALDLTNYI